MKPTVSEGEWSSQELNLIQALLGTVSANFRLVSLRHTGLKWQVRFVLEQDLAEDREEIDDFITEFDSLQDEPLDFDVVVEVESDLIKTSDSTERVVYQRRESAGRTMKS